MKYQKYFTSLIFAILLVLAAAAIVPTYAGGPLFVDTTGQPVRWATHMASGGPLSTQTVDAQKRVIYRVDSGGLGPLSNAEAVSLVDRIFKAYTDIPTATIEFVNGGPILDTKTGKAVDITGNNVGMVLGRTPSFQNPIVFDNDGSITGTGGVLGFFTFLNFGQSQNGGLELLEGAVALNGPALGRIGKVPFIGVFTHEFGHFAGPLDHSQIYGWIASGSSAANPPAGFTSAQLFDVYSPFVETLYPFFFGGPSSSKMAQAGFNNSGPFTASLSFDDIVAMSALYPEPGYLPSESGSQVGGISGRVVIRTTSGDVPITGLNVVVRRISRGQYPPAPTLEVYKNNNIPLDKDGAPLPPEDRDELDPMITSASQVSGVLGGSGVYNFLGLPPGDYMVSVERINPNALGGSSIGPRDPQLVFTSPENYNGTGESNDPNTDNPRDFTPVRVVAGAVTPNIDFILNGLGGSTTTANEAEPNESKKQAQPINIQSVIMGEARANDASVVNVDFGGGQLVPIQDLYRIDVTTASSLFISMEGANPSADLDIFLFSKAIKKKVSANSAFIIGASFSPTNSELIASRVLSPGTYYIGVGASASSKYRLTVLSQQ